jgi:hypothetical protein
MNKKYIGMSVLAYGISVVPPLVATLCQFPLWIDTSAQCTLSGLTILLLFLCIAPLIKAAKLYLKSPSIPLVWSAVAVMAFVARSIIEQVCFISVVGVVSSVIGWCLFKYRDKNYKDA